MCGLTGFWQPGAHADALAPIARAMAARIAHRGPDDDGVWTDAEAGIALAHRRLSILDLSPAGHQPMPSASGCGPTRSPKHGLEHARVLRKPQAMSPY